MFFYSSAGYHFGRDFISEACLRIVLTCRLVFEPKILEVVAVDFFLTGKVFVINLSYFLQLF